MPRLATGGAAATLRGEGDAPSLPLTKVFFLTRRDEHALPLAVMIEGGKAQLAPDATSLDAAERHLQVDAPTRVDRDHPRLDGTRHAQGPREVPRPEGAGEAIRRAVGQPDGLLLAVERQDGDDRTEDLLLGERHGGGHVAEDRGTIEAAAIEGLAPQRLPAGTERRSLFHALPDVGVHPLAVLARDERADLGRIQKRVADAESPGARHEALDDQIGRAH